MQSSILIAAAGASAYGLWRRVATRAVASPADVPLPQARKVRALQQSVFSLTQCANRHAVRLEGDGDWDGRAPSHPAGQACALPAPRDSGQG